MSLTLRLTTVAVVLFAGSVGLATLLTAPGPSSRLERSPGPGDTSSAGDPSPALQLPCTPQERRVDELPKRAAPAPRLDSAADRILEAAERLAQSLDPDASVSPRQVVEFICLLLRAVDGQADPETLGLAGIRFDVRPSAVRVRIPTVAAVDGQTFTSGRLEVELHLAPGQLAADVRRILVPGGTAAPHEAPELRGLCPATSRVRIDFGDWRSGDWSWELQDGWFEHAALSGLRFAPREGVLDLGETGRGCLTPERLRAWAAALPWMGPSPPPMKVGDEIPLLYAAAEALARNLDPGRAPALSEVLGFLRALTALNPLPTVSGRAVQEISVQCGAKGLLVRVPVRSGVLTPGFRAGFLVLRVARESSQPAILLWRELIPALADPALLDLDELDPRFCGTQPCSSWVKIDPVSLHMSVGDIYLFSREPSDWLPGEPRAGYDELPLHAVDPCLFREHLWSWAQLWVVCR